MTRTAKYIVYSNDGQRWGEGVVVELFNTKSEAMAFAQERVAESDANWRGEDVFVCEILLVSLADDRVVTQDGS